MGSYAWTYPKPYFGGLSGIDLTPDGRNFVVIGDAGQLIFGTIRREGGQIVGLDFDQVKSLHTPTGARVKGLAEFDAEGLALTAEGRIYVSFEQVARVWAYDDWLGPAIPMPSHPDFAGFPANGGLEALAVAPDGTLYTVPEQAAAGPERRKVYRYRNGAWSVFGTIDVPGAFWPVGADIGPDGRFYLLERRYLPLVGFASRVRRFAIGRAGLEAPEVLFETGFGVHDNLEGIAVWRDAAGAIRLTMVSDDNRSRFQETELVEYALP